MKLFKFFPVWISLLCSKYFAQIVKMEASKVFKKLKTVIATIFEKTLNSSGSHFTILEVYNFTDIHNIT